MVGCSGLKEISPADPVYNGVKIVFDGDDKRVERVIEEVYQNIDPQPNPTFLWMRPAVARYNMISDSAKTKKFWVKKIAEPVTLSMTDPQRMTNIFSNRLWHYGYFNNTVNYDTIRQGKKRVKYQFNVELHTPTVIGAVKFPAVVDTLTSLIAESSKKSLLKTGKIYALEDLKAERTRIDRYLRDNGYIYFNPDFIGFTADTVTSEGSVNIELSIQPETPPESRKQFYVRKLIVLDDFRQDLDGYDTLSYHPYYIVTRDSTLSFSALEQGLFIKPNEVYSRKTRSFTTGYMNRLPIIQSATTNFIRVPATDSLDAYLSLSKRKRYAYSAELNAIFRSTNYFGPGIVFSITDRNRRRSADRLQINLRGRVEVQIADGVINPAYELGLEINYQLPRLIPRFLKNIGPTYIPQTRLSTGYNLFNRLDLYRLNSVFLNFGYRWQKNQSVTHIVNPFEAIFTSIPEASKSDVFKDYLEQNPGVRRSFEEQFVVGASYEYIYNPPPGLRGDFRFRGGIDFAGNVLAGLYGLFNADRDTAGAYNLFGVPFSQYTRLRLDFGYEYRFNAKSSIATRFITGLGIPYGNSDILPYLKQFYVGGTNSLRSFLARSLGPGSEVPPDGFNDLTGDIRLEANLEYRFTISRKFKGALFIDAGNIWLYNEDPSRPDGNFTFSTFLDDIAISGGWGLRWDFEFVVARLDFAYDVRTPYLEEGKEWTRGIKFWQPTFNIAIGYPF